MSKKLFVASLSWDVDNATLEQAFNGFGEITKCHVVTHREGQLKGKSRGFGFVEFESPDDAQKALEQMNGAPIDGRPVIVNWATEKARPSGQLSGSPGSKGVKNVTAHVT